MLNLPSIGWEEKIPDVFEVTKWWLKEHQVFLMIGTAISLAMAVLTIIARLFIEDDDDDFDYREI